MNGKQLSAHAMAISNTRSCPSASLMHPQFFSIWRMISPGSTWTNVVVYLDDILIFSKDQKTHDKHVRLMLATLREHGLYAKLEKCEFDKSLVAFLGYVISPDGIFMDKSKVETIQCWATPSSVKDVQRFLGFANFYRRFIKGYSKITTSLTTLTCKDKLFSWNPTAQAAFDTLKMAFTSAPILIHPDPAKPFIVETDA